MGKLQGLGENYVVRRTCRKAHLLPCNRVVELQLHRLKQMALGLERQMTVFCLIAIERITDYGMTQMRRMHTYLVHTTGFDHKFDNRKASALIQHSPMGDGRFAIGHINRHALCVPRFPSNRRPQRSRRRLWCAMQDSQISLADSLVALKRFPQLQIGSSGLRKHDHSAGVGV